jgi:hypothetical protein
MPVPWRLIGVLLLILLNELSESLTLASKD